MEPTEDEIKADPGRASFTALHLIVTTRYLQEQGTSLDEVHETSGEQGLFSLVASPVGRAIAEVINIWFGDWMASGALDGFVKPIDDESAKEAVVRNCEWLVTMTWPLIRADLETQMRVN